MIRWGGADLTVGPEHRFALRGVEVSRSPGGNDYSVVVELVPNSGMLPFSADRLGRPMAIFVGEEPVRVLMVRDPLPNELRLAGRWTEREARALAERMLMDFGVPTEGGALRGSDLINEGRPTIEMALLLTSSDRDYEAPNLVVERDGRELRFGKLASFEVESGFASQDREGRTGIGYVVVDEVGFRAFTREHTGRQVGVFVNQELLAVPVIEGEIPGRGVLTGGVERFSEKRVRELLAYLRGDG